MIMSARLVPGHFMKSIRLYSKIEDLYSEKHLIKELMQIKAKIL